MTDVEEGKKRAHLQTPIRQWAPWTLFDFLRYPGQQLGSRTVFCGRDGCRTLARGGGGSSGVRGSCGANVGGRDYLNISL